ncbi:MAG: transketolase [Lachnospiraceae bacterium]|nr:transketolase [Lachnospiraceae bacterium]
MADKTIVKNLDSNALEIRLKLLKLCEQTLIHIGGDLSVTDVMTVIWQYAMNYDVKNPAWEDRDRFILSKGHASAVTSFNQAMRGCFSYEEIYREYCTDNGRFGMHSCNLLNPFVDVSTGSLGHGLPVATGLAMGLRLKKNHKSRVFTVMGDGELNEGTMWEAVATANQYKLGNLVGFVDNNHMSFDGTNKEVMDMGNLTDKFRLYGWHAIEVNGHDINDLVDTVNQLPAPDSLTPSVIIANTIKGNGVDFMADSPAWHAGKIDEETRQKAEEQLVAAFKKKWGDS